MTFGTTANSTTHMRFLGIEDFWGNIWEWVDGLTTDGSRNLITSWNSFSGEDITAT
jgi:formylglycine-generating enzyme required for sulfatase activity